jgi:hypothetical protein
MINQHEIAALVDLANRAPKTMAENQWLKSLVERLNAELEKRETLTVASSDSVKKKASGG